jgi:hypothetical protein
VRGSAPGACLARRCCQRAPTRRGHERQSSYTAPGRPGEARRDSANSGRPRPTRCGQPSQRLEPVQRHRLEQQGRPRCAAQTRPPPGSSSLPRSRPPPSADSASTSPPERQAGQPAHHIRTRRSSSDFQPESGRSAGCRAHGDLFADDDAVVHGTGGCPVVVGGVRGGVIAVTPRRGRDETPPNPGHISPWMASGTAQPDPRWFKSRMHAGEGRGGLGVLAQFGVDAPCFFELVFQDDDAACRVQGGTGVDQLPGAGGQA